MKFEFKTNDSKVVDGVTVYRIRATETFETPYKTVKKGELGGYICDDTDLGDGSWVFGKAVVIDCSVSRQSFITGDYVYKCIILTNSSIEGTGNYNNERGYNEITDINVVGHNFFEGSEHSVIWGVDKDTSDIMISVGCQFYSLDDWKEEYEDIAEDQGYAGKRVTEYLGYLKQIEDSLKPSNEKILEKISSNVSNMKVSVTEALKTETISLISSLQVSQKVVVQSGPKRCPKTGRWLKKNP